MMDKKILQAVRPALKEYVENTILPRYAAFQDKAHSTSHILSVIEESFALCLHLDLFGTGAAKFGSGPLSPDLVYTIAAYHDIGMPEGRERHHLTSGRILSEDKQIREWFTEEEITLMREAVEDHRASSQTTPRSLYGRVVSEADKKIDPDEIIGRTILYGLSHYPELTPEEQKKRNLQHLCEKYGQDGYLKLQFENSPNAERLAAFQALIRAPKALEEEYSKFEVHPLPPFLPQEAKVLFLGSFPPPQARWCMSFYYPNWINDMWRILGHIFHQDKEWLVLKGEKKFDYKKVVHFCDEIGLAIFDAAYLVKREKGNASDKFLKIVVPSDLQTILEQLPDCQAVVSTGGKSAETIAAILGCNIPKPGTWTPVSLPGNSSRQLRFYRMPSSSRAYPMAIENKAEAYRKMFEDIGMKLP